MFTTEYMLKPIKSLKYYLDDLDSVKNSIWDDVFLSKFIKSKEDIERDINLVFHMNNEERYKGVYTQKINELFAIWSYREIIDNYKYTICVLNLRDLITEITEIGVEDRINEINHMLSTLCLDINTKLAKDGIKLLLEKKVDAAANILKNIDVDLDKFDGKLDNAFVHIFDYINSVIEKKTKQEIQTMITKLFDGFDMLKYKYAIQIGKLYTSIEKLESSPSRHYIRSFKNILDRLVGVNVENVDILSGWNIVFNKEFIVYNSVNYYRNDTIDNIIKCIRIVFKGKSVYYLNDMISKLEITYSIFESKSNRSLYYLDYILIYRYNIPAFKDINNVDDVIKAENLLLSVLETKGIKTTGVIWRRLDQTEIDKFKLEYENAVNCKC
jgi:hypothetical protein